MTPALNASASLSSQNCSLGRRRLAVLARHLPVRAAAARALLATPLTARHKLRARTYAALVQMARLPLRQGVLHLPVRLHANFNVGKLSMHDDSL